MINKFLSSTMLLFILLSAVVFAHTATIENGGHLRYKAVRLTPQIYNLSSENLADILIKDQNQETVPYFINGYTESGSDIQESYGLKLLNSFIKDEFFYFDYALAQTQNKDVLATSIDITTSTTDFAKKIELFGSYDNVNWEKIQDDTLYRVDNSAKLSIVFDKPQKFTHYRFKLSNNLEKLSFDSAVLKYNDTLKRRDYFIQSIQPQFTVEQQDKKTVVSIQGLKNLEISDITIDTDSVFKRTITYANNRSKQLYNLSFNGTLYRDTVLPFDGYKTQDDMFKISILNKDDKPITITGITVTYFAQDVIFEGKKENNYTLVFGKSENALSPSYDIVNYKDFIIKEGYDLLSIQNVPEENTTEKSSKQVDYTMIFNVVVLVIALLLGSVILLKLKKK